MKATERNTFKVSRLFQDLQGCTPEQKIDLLLACLTEEQKNLLLSCLTKEQ